MTSLFRAFLVFAAVVFSTAWAASAPGPASAAASNLQVPGAEGLKARHAELRDALERSSFGRPILLQSGEGESGRMQRGDVYAIVDYPFTVVQRGLGEAPSWCDVMILPYNTKHCHANATGPSTSLTVRIGRKAGQAPEDANPITFQYTVQSRTADNLRVVLDAADGPLGTRDYRIVLEATPLDEKRTFLHLGYSYGFSTIARFAMQAYLATAGANKVGFTVTGKDRNGDPVYVGGMLGATERNTMRYFLAIDAYLRPLSTPEAQRVEKRLNG